MAKGMSPLRLFMRNPPRKTVADSIDGSSAGPDGTGAAAQSRQPLGPITETVRNPLIPIAEQSSGDPSTPRAKAKVLSHGQEKFPHLENSEVYATSINVTPEKTASPHSKGKFTWQHRHGSTAHNTTRDGPPPLSTPPRPPKGSASSDGQAANNQDTLQNVSSNLRGCSTGGGSVPSTPKTGRSVGGKSTTESESGGSQSQNATPCKSASRALKYGQQGSSSNAGASGLTNVRSTVSQHVISRPIGYLQAVKGVLPQSTNQNFVEHHFELEEDASFWRDHNVQVIIRTRPISNSELASQGSNRCLRQESPHTLSWLGQPESRFTFDHVAGETITQAKLFDVAGLPMVENCMSGYNSCMFAYGQTGSGKTHTMLGDIENLDRSPSENRGMTPRVFEYLFGRIRKEQECRRQEHLKFFCKCSFLEIYNEQITDLLEPSSTNLQMREDAKKGVYVENLSEVEVQCVQDVIQLLLQGAANRKVAATNMNRESSRSHSVFTCVVESKWENNSMTNSRYGRLHLVDLAGSERQKSSGAEGGRLKEAANINKSLSTLGLVIMILVDVANGKQRHVPYRDSKLTFLLQDSLGGNSKTIMIANVSPSSCCAMETLSTLKFAQRAKFIRNNAVINEDASGDVAALRQRIEELKVEVDRLRHERRMARISTSRISALEYGSVAGQNCGDEFDASTLDCTVIEGSTSDSRNANKSQTVSIANNDKMRSIEAVLAGALRREQQAEDITKKLAAEIEQLNRLVRQREEDSQCSKMMLRFREEKIRRLEGIADNVMSTEAFYEDERKNLIDELQLIRGRLDRNPELTRFAMENIRLMEELRRYQEFYDGGERDVLLEEILGLRSQLLEMLDPKLGEEQTIETLLTPQKRSPAPELSALERENELLLIEVKSYQNELKECRNNLNSCLVANADLARQVDELQATVKQLKNERSQKHEESREPSLSLDEEAPNRIRGARASLHAPQETTSSADPTTAHVRLETEELALQQRQALTNVEEQVMELRNQLNEAQDLIQKLSSEVEEANELSDRRKLNENVPCIAEDDVIVRQGLQDRWEKLQEIEMRHSEEITQLQLELDSMEDVLKEERQQRLLADHKIDDLSSQLSATISKLEQAQGLVEDGFKQERQQSLLAEQKSEELSCQLSATVSKLEEAQCLVEALEGQQLFSINELENLQSEHTKLLRKMTQQEEGEGELQRQFQDEKAMGDPAVCILEQKLLRAKRAKEEARRINRKFQQEKASRMVLDKEREVTMSEVETQAALAITTLQSEILELREEVSFAVESEATAKLRIAHLQKEVENLQKTIGQLEDSNKNLSDKSDGYRNIVDEKHAQLRGLEAGWESSASRLIDYLSDGDKALSEAVREMDEIKQGKVSQMDDHIVENGDTAASVYHRLQGVQFMIRETEGKVRTLSDAKATLGKATDFKFEDGEAMIRESEKKSMVAFLMVGELLERIRNLKAAQQRLVQENQEAYSKEVAKDLQAAALQQQLEELRRQFGDLQDEHHLMIRAHEDLRQENHRSSLELKNVNEFKAENIKLEKEIRDSGRALMAAHEKLQQQQARYLDDKAFEAKEAEELVRLSERKAMAVLVVVEQLLGNRNDLKAANMILAREIQDGGLLLGAKQTALATLEQKLEQDNHQYKEIADQYQLLAETYVNLQQEHNRLLAGNALRVEEVEALVRLSERKAMAAFVVLEDLLERMKELQTTKTCLAKQIGEAQLTLAEKDTTLTALQNELSECSDVASRCQVVTEAHENLRQDHERLVHQNAFTAIDGEREIKLSERKAMATFVILRQVLDGKKTLTEETERLKRETEEAHVALAEKNTELVALDLKLEQSSYQSAEIADKHQILICAHDILREEHEKQQEEFGKARERHEVLHEALVKGRQAQERLQERLETEREEHEGQHKELVKAQDDHEGFVRELERMIKSSEKKAMGSLVLIEHLMESLKVLKVTENKLEKEFQEEHSAHLEKASRLQDLQRQLEESQTYQKEVCDENQFLFEKYGNLEKEHDTRMGENRQLKRQVEVLELGLRSYHAQVRLLKDLSVAAEQQCTEAYNKALSIAMKVNSVHDMKVAESLEFMTNVRDGLQVLWHEVSFVEAAVDQLGSVGRELGACRSNVLMLEEENGGNMSAMQRFQTEISRLAMTLQLRERDLEMALEKETTFCKYWEEERVKLIGEKEQSRRDCVQREEMVQSLVLEVQRLDSTVKDAELRVSDMLTGVQALTVAKEELELENSRQVLAARQGETNCSEKELQIAAIQGDLADVRARLSAAELREQSVSERVEELTAAMVEWEIERAVVEHEMQQMRVEKHKLRLHENYLNLEMEKRETTILESFRTSQEALEIVDARMAAVEEELARLEMSKGNLEHDIALLESAASSAVFSLEEKELECLAMKEQLGNAVVQITQMQTAIDLGTAQFALEKSNREADERRMEEETLACQTQLRDEIVSAELILMSTQGRLETDVRRLDSSLKQTEFRVSQMLRGVKALTVAREELELEKCRLVLAASQAEIHCGQKEQELGATQRDLTGLRSRLMEAELREKLLCAQMEELTGPKIQWEVQRADVDFSGQKQDDQVLRAKISEKDRTILSAKKEMQIAIANLKEAELEMDKVHRQNHTLTQIQLENTSTIDSLSLELKTAEDELVKRDIKIEGCEAELQKVVAIMSDWERKMHDVEIEWRREKETLAQELTEAQLVANEKRTEAAALLQKFHDGQATLKEAEDLVDALVKANENAKHDALDWKTEKESLGIVQGWWMPERDKLVSKIAGLETDMHAQKQDIWIMCKETVNGLVETMDVLLVVDKELSELKNDHQEDMDHLVGEMKVLEGDLVARLFDLEGEMVESFENMQTVVGELTSGKNRALKDSADLRVEIASLNANMRSLESQLEEKSNKCLMDHFTRSDMTALAMERKQETCLVRQKREDAEHNRRIAMSQARHESRMPEWSENNNADSAEKQQLTQNDQSNQFLKLYHQELVFTQEILAGSLTFSETLVSQMQEISLELEELNLMQEVGTLDHKFRSDMEVIKVEILNFGKAAHEEITTWRLRRNVTQKDNERLMGAVQDLQSKNSVLNGELDDKMRCIDILAEELVIKEQRIANSLQRMNSQLKAVENERDKYQTDLVVLNEQLEMAQTLADERDIVAAEVRQAAERSKSHAEEKEEEARILERSVEELESTVYALESQLDIVKRESERQRVARETLEKELEALKRQMAMMQVTIDSQDAQTVRDFQSAETSKTELDRIVIEMKNQQIQARKSVESLQQECAEKDVQLRSCKAHIVELMLGAEKQASENQQKLKTLEAMVEHLKVEERKVNPAGGSVSKAVEKSTGKVKGAGSPFKCIGSGLEKQRSSEMDEELSAARKRIKELETVAASRQKEVFMLNTKLAEAESMTHDVVRDLLGVKMDIASYATLLNQQQVQRIAERARRRTVEAQQKEDELGTLRDRLNEFIEERESWLEEINRRQAEAVAARVSAEKLRLRDQTLTADNDIFREDCHALRKKAADLEEEIKKLSGQQNLQQRIHHHAKIKEENNSIRLQNEDLSGKLRRMEILFTRVNDELARYRTAEGKSAFLNFDEEARLQKKLQETEENRLQLAETLIGLCTGIMQAAGIQRESRDLDPSAAMTALQLLQDRQESLERELSDSKLKARITVEKRRLSDLRDLHTPMKTICTNTNFTACQQLPSPVSSSR